ncbi:MAG: Gfo/Idh/MocA family oxidoreductase [Oscillospiraceae bacterium]|nr:Gfo/Idh/MocA family oxidoreductase [Oscillospiraceae bacterium]
MSDKKRIGIGLVGTGFMAKAHSNAFHTMPYIYHTANYYPELVAIGAATLAEAEEAKVRYSYEKAAAGYEEIVADPLVDVVDICASDALHVPIALAALGKGKHVLCEKPLALNAKDAKILRDAAAKSEAVSMVGFNYRFVSAVVLAKRLIDSGMMGKVYHFEGQYLQDVGAFDDTPIEKLWYAQGSKGSGVALGIGCHLIDMARYLVGEIEEVGGLLPIHNPTRSSADGSVEVTQDEEMHILARFSNGATGSLRASAVAAGRKNCLRWEISCSKGSLVFDLENLNHLDVFLKETPIHSVTGFTRVNVTQLDRDHPFMDVWWPRGHIVGWEHAHINQLAHLLDCITNDRPIAPLGATFEDGYRSIQIIDTLREAILEGRFKQVLYE